MAKLTVKQKRFCDEYLIDLNATQAAIRAEYSAKTAYSIGIENLKKPVIKNYIEKKLEEISSQKIATINEIMEHLTAVMRNEITEEVVVVEGTGEGYSKATIANKGMSEKDRLKAAELLGKRYGMFTEKIKLDAPVPIVISGEDKLED